MSKFAVLSSMFILVIFGLNVDSNSFEHVPPVQSAFEETPSQIVENFYDLSALGEYDKALELVGAYPDEYFDAKDQEVNEYRQMIGEVPPPPPKVAADPGHKSGIKLGNPENDPFREWMALDSNQQQAKVIHDDKLYIAEIVRTWINGKESRVRVKVRSHQWERYLGVNDVLLYKKDSTWKIFLVDTPGLINKYGIPGKSEITRPITKK